MSDNAFRGKSAESPLPAAAAAVLDAQLHHKAKSEAAAAPAGPGHIDGF